MKIHYEWEAKDIEAGMRVSPADRNDQVLIVGWANWLCGDNKKRYMIIDPRDGMVYYPPNSKARIAERLTSMNYRPRPELRDANP